MLENNREETVLYDRLFYRLGITNLLDHYEIVSERQADQPGFVEQQLDRTNKNLLLAVDSNPHGSKHYQQFAGHRRIKILSGNLNYLFDTSPLRSYADAEYYFPSSSYSYFPYFFLTQLDRDNIQPPHKTLRFSFLSSQPRPHRLYLYQKVKAHITEKDCFAVHIDLEDLKKYDPDNEYQAIDLTQDLPYYSGAAGSVEELTNFKTKNKSLGGDHTNIHNAYGAIFNITGESSDINDTVFLSEKTWKCIRSQCMPIAYGNPGSVTALSKLGFCFDYDRDLDCASKAEWIAEIMRDWDWDYCIDFFNQNVEIVRHNVMRFYSRELRDIFTHYLRGRLELP